MKLLICCDMSTLRGSIAFVRAGKVLSYREWEREKSHSELFLLHASQALEEAGGGPIGAIAVGIGPGSFTGLRVAVNFAKTLSYSTGVPIYPFNSHELISYNSLSRPLIVMTNAFGDAVFLSKFVSSEEGVNQKGPACVRITEIDSTEWTSEPSLCLGEGFDIYREKISPVVLSRLVRDPELVDFPKASVWGPKVEALLTKRNEVSWKDLTPLYIRASAAEEKL